MQKKKSGAFFIYGELGCYQLKLVLVTDIDFFVVASGKCRGKI